MKRKRKDSTMSCGKVASAIAAFGYSGMELAWSGLLQLDDVASKVAKQMLRIVPAREVAEQIRARSQRRKSVRKNVD